MNRPIEGSVRARYGAGDAAANVWSWSLFSSTITKTCLIGGRAEAGAARASAPARTAARASPRIRASFRKASLPVALKLLNLVPLQELLADHHALDLGSDLADQEEGRVPVEALDLVLLRVAVAAVDAERVLHDLLAGLRGEQLRHAGLEVRALAGVLEAGGLAGEEACGLDLGRHVRELELDRLVLRDRLAERLWRLRVTERQLERARGDADAAGRDVHPPHLERVHHLAEALVEAGLLAAEDAGGRAAIVAVDELGRLDALVAHLLDLGRDLEALELARVLLGARLLLGDEARHALVGRARLGVRLRDQEPDAATQAVRDPHLLAVDEPVVAVLLGARRDRLHIGAEARLREREGGAELAGRHLRQEVLLLLVAAELHEQVRADEMGVDDAGDADPAARELLDDHRVGREVEPHPAVLLGDRHAEQPELLHLLDDRVGERILVVVLLGDRDHLLVHELPHHLGDRALLVGLLGKGGRYGQSGTPGLRVDSRVNSTASAAGRAPRRPFGCRPASSVWSFAPIRGKSPAGWSFAPREASARGRS